MTALYNEIDPFAAAWLRELIAGGHIAPGIVIEDSIEDLTPNDLKPFHQVHFFAGIGVWSYALRRVGWPDDRRIWTGSCPCQPFSAAGKGGGFADERHLWPAFFHLITQCRPDVIVGEQVASKDGLAWLDLVQTDMERAGHAFGAVDLCAAGVGAPHIRQRLWWVARRMADADGSGQHPHVRGEQNNPVEDPRSRSIGGLVEPMAEASKFGGVAQSEGLRREWREGAAQRGEPDGPDAGRFESNHGLVGVGQTGDGSQWPGPTNGHWRDADWLHCRDGKWRPVEPGTFPLAHGAAARVGRLRGYGNAIVAQAAEEFLRAALT